METITEITNRIIQEKGSTASSPTPAYKCAACEDTGWIHFEKDGYSYVRECVCRKAQKAERIIRNSGLGEMLDRKTFDSFQVEKPWQREMLDLAKRYTAVILGGQSERMPWLYLGGNPGCGKTHICTAICGKLLKHHIPVKYMRWNEESRKLKSYANEPDFEGIAAPYLDAPVLYVDDLFKQQYKLGGPYLNDADIRLAFTVLDGRYTQNLPTIISSEWNLRDDLLPVDEGTFSRVYERSKGYELEITRGTEHNFRLFQAV